MLSSKYSKDIIYHELSKWFKNSKMYLRWHKHKNTLGDRERQTENILGPKTLQLDTWPSSAELIVLSWVFGRSQLTLCQMLYKHQGRKQYDSEFRTYQGSRWLHRNTTDCTSQGKMAQVGTKPALGPSQGELNGPWEALMGIGVGRWPKGRCRSEQEDSVIGDPARMSGRHCSPPSMSYIFPEDAITQVRNAVLITASKSSSACHISAKYGWHREP